MTTFNIEINTTKSCNMRCTYCFEAKDEMNKNFDFQKPDEFIQFVEDIIQTDYFKENHSDFCIAFWGGEATLNQKLYEQITSHFKGNDKVWFLLYSNGLHYSDWYIESFKELQKSKANGHSKIVVQVSYDGCPVHDQTRITPNGKGTAEQVKRTIKRLQDEGIFYVVKSTIVPEGFSDLYDAYRSVISVILPGQSYFPSIDFHKEYANEAEYKIHSMELYESLVKIAKYELETGENLFMWFNGPNQAKCSAGVNMVSVDLNGDMLPCHGAQYTNTAEHTFSNISDTDAIPALIESIQDFKRFWKNEPQKCKNCTNMFCNRCNIIKHSLSEKETYEEKWTDYLTQDYLCHFFDVSSVVAKAKNNINN